MAKTNFFQYKCSKLLGPKKPFFDKYVLINSTEGRANLVLIRVWLDHCEPIIVNLCQISVNLCQIYAIQIYAIRQPHNKDVIDDLLTYFARPTLFMLLVHTIRTNFHSILCVSASE